MNVFCLLCGGVLYRASHEPNGWRHFNSGKSFCERPWMVEAKTHYEPTPVVRLPVEFGALRIEVGRAE